MSRRTVLVSGATSGIGREAARVLARAGWYVLVLGRDPRRTEELASEIGGRAVVANLASMASLRAAAARVREDVARLDALVCNAGVQEMGRPTSTVDAYDTTFGVNHLATFALVAELRPVLAPGARVVVVSSGTHDPATMEGRFNPPAEVDVGVLAWPATAAALSGVRRYTTSKLCNVLFAYELARRAPALSVTAFDPGAVPGTGLTREWSPFMRAVATKRTVLGLLGVKTATVDVAGAALAAVVEAPEVAPYTRLGQPRRSSARSYDEQLARRLWDDTEALLAAPADANVLPFPEPTP